MTSLRIATSTRAFETGELSDVTFIVGTPREQKKFKLHKLVLCFSSDVFQTMFLGSMPETNEVEVPDIKPSIFEIAMKYLYTERFSVNSVEEAIHTYYVAEKYNIEQLEKACVIYIQGNLCTKSVSLLYEMPIILDNPDIYDSVKSMLSEKTQEVFRSEYIFEYPMDMVKDIVQLENMSIQEEDRVFRFVLYWAKSYPSEEPSQEEIRRTMDHFLPYIRFLSMEVASFLSGPANSGVLTDIEIISISMNLAKPGIRELPSWCSKNSNKRNFVPSSSPPYSLHFRKKVILKDDRFKRRTRQIKLLTDDFH